MIPKISSHPIINNSKTVQFRISVKKMNYPVTVGIDHKTRSQLT